MSDYSTVKQYNKLVRDGIPAHLESKGVPYKSHIADETAYEEKLLQKLDEEFQEFKSSQSPDELADIFEVLDAIITHKGYTREQILSIQRTKASLRGRFQNRIILEES